MYLVSGAVTINTEVAISLKLELVQILGILHRHVNQSIRQHRQSVLSNKCIVQSLLTLVYYT